MKETKSELKVAVGCIAIIALPLLGIDIQSIANFLGSSEAQEATKVVSEGVEQLKTFSDNNQQTRLSGYIAMIGIAYGAYRTAVKSVGKWAKKGERHGEDKVGETLG